jgi:hypothetical protein
MPPCLWHIPASSTHSRISSVCGGLSTSRSLFVSGRPPSLVSSASTLLAMPLSFAFAGSRHCYFPPVLAKFLKVSLWGLVPDLPIPGMQRGLLLTRGEIGLSV